MDQRLLHSKLIYNRLDPIYIFLDRIVFKLLFRPPKVSLPGRFEKLESAEVDFLLENMSKHRIILWINILFSIFLYVSGLDFILEHGNTAIVVTGLLAPAMITGGAWYSISFGGIPEKFISVAYYLTLLMFLSFTLSMTLLTLLLIAITPLSIGLTIILPIYITLYFASMLYDNVDGLKIGLDSTLLKFSRANLNYYQKHGLITSNETQQESFGEGAVESGQIALFTYYLRTLERNLDQLEEEKGLKIANHLIASSTDLLFNILDLFPKQGVIVDRGEKFEAFLKHGYSDKQEEVDKLTIEHLKKIITLMSLYINDTYASDALTKIQSKLSDFEKELITVEGVTGEERQQAQYFADHIFSQAFRQLAELASAYRDVLFKEGKKHE